MVTREPHELGLPSPLLGRAQAAHVRAWRRRFQALRGLRTPFRAHFEQRRQLVVLKLHGALRMSGRSVDAWNAHKLAPSAEVIVAVPASNRPRRLDVGVLRRAAHRLGYASELDAVTAACSTTRDSSSVRGAAGSILDGQPPGAFARATMASFLGVDELELWPVEETSVRR